MSKRQNERVVLVTGASSGIGREVAIHLARSGYRVFGASRSVSPGATADGFSFIRMDVVDEKSVQDGIGEIIRLEGRLDAVINNAGLGMIGPLECTSDQEAREIFDTNVFGVLNVCRAALPHLRASGNGYIINITSLAAQIGLPYRGIYSASKFAVEGFTESLSQEVKRFGIRTVIIEPGDVKTSINTNRKMASVIRPEYADDHERITRQVCEEVNKAQGPEIIAKRVEKILCNPSPRLRYRAAGPVQRFSLTLMRLLPGRWFEKIIMWHYKLGK